MDMNDYHIIPGFSAVRMKRELQAQFQEKTAGMSFEELRRLLDKTRETWENPPTESRDRTASHPFTQN